MDTLLHLISLLASVQPSVLNTYLCPSQSASIIPFKLEKEETENPKKPATPTLLLQPARLQVERSDFRHTETVHGHATGGCHAGTLDPVLCADFKFTRHFEE